MAITQGMDKGYVNQKVLPVIGIPYSEEVDRLVGGKNKWHCLNAAMLMFIRASDDEKDQLITMVQKLETIERRALSETQSPAEAEEALRGLQTTVCSLLGMNDGKRPKVNRGKKRRA